MQTGPTTWAWVTQREPPKRGELPLPYVISDIMEPTEQVDGRFYTSKRAFRASGKAHGLIEVGNEKPKPRPKLSQTRAASEGRRASIKKAVEQVRAGNINSKRGP